jgi:chemotaxis protein CheY-P-specific phosphatase CheC
MTTDSTRRLTVPLEKLATLNALGELGVDGVASRLRQLDDYDGTVETELVKSGVVTERTLRTRFEDDVRAGVRVRLPGAPYGYALALFPPGSANNAAALMLSDAVEDVSEASTEMARSALTELGGYMINGFLDAWADTFEQRIDVGAPSAVHDSERAVVWRTVQSGEDLGLYITARLRIPASGIVAQVYLLPRNETFLDILARIDMEMLE